MKTLAFLTLLFIMSGSAVGRMFNVSGFVGEDVLFSFNCSKAPNELIWQKGSRVVNAHSKETFSIDDSYVNRTQLFINQEKTNCSLELHNLSIEDAGLYTSYAMFLVENNVWLTVSSEFNLTVSEKPSTDLRLVDGGNPDTTASVSVTIPVVILILAAILALTLLIKRCHWRKKETHLPAEEPMLQTV